MTYATVRISDRQIERARRVTGHRSAQTVTDYALKLLVLRGYAKDDGPLGVDAIRAIRKAEPQMDTAPTHTLFPL